MKQVIGDFGLPITGTKAVLGGRVSKAIEQGMYLVVESNQSSIQKSDFGIEDCPLDGWKDQQDEIYSACPVVSVAAILLYM